MAHVRDRRRPGYARVCLAVLLPLMMVSASGCLERRAVLEVSTRELDFGGESSLSSFTVRNAGKDGLLTAGVAPLEYRISSDRDWLAVTPSSGSCGGQQQNTHAVAIDRARLLVGNNIATISLSSNDGPWTIMVRADREPSSCGDPPIAPWNPAPAIGATGVPVGTDLVWNDGTSRCPGLIVTYDVYFGATSPPPFAHDNGGSKAWDPGTLAHATTYYWRVVAKDANGSTSGAEWRFTTSAVSCAAAPGAVTPVAPGNGATSVSIDPNLLWTGGDSQCPGLTSTFDVHFGTTSPPPFAHDNGGSKAWAPGTLARATTYYWRIVARDANGSTTGPLWSFTTEEPCFALPTAACAPAPASEATNVNENTDLAWSCGASQCDGLAPTYDVYFGTSPTPGPAEFLGNTASRTWALPRQVKNTTYYWRIVTQDANGSTPGPVWSFRTRT